MRLCATFTILLTCFALQSFAQQPGNLDSSFGVNGKVTTSFSANDDHAYTVKELSNGTLLIAGFTKPGAHSDFMLTRYTPGGSLDITFGSSGSVSFDLNGSDDVCYAVDEQTDGKILMAGRTYSGTDNDFALVRLLSNGTLDNTFGTGGKVTTPIGSADDYGRAMAIQNDGKILVAGYSRIGTNDEFAVLRYLSDGSLDNSFGTGGKALIGIGASHDLCFGIQLQADGKIVLSGHSVVGTHYDYDSELRLVELRK